MRVDHLKLKGDFSQDEITKKRCATVGIQDKALPQLNSRPAVKGTQTSWKETLRVMIRFSIIVNYSPFQIVNLTKAIHRIINLHFYFLSSKMFS